jgi:hypothetical protein
MRMRLMFPRSGAFLKLKATVCPTTRGAGANTGPALAAERAGGVSWGAWRKPARRQRQCQAPPPQRPLKFPLLHAQLCSATLVCNLVAAPAGVSKTARSCVKAAPSISPTV